MTILKIAALAAALILPASAGFAQSSAGSTGTGASGGSPSTSGTSAAGNASSGSSNGSSRGTTARSGSSATQPSLCDADNPLGTLTNDPNCLGR